MKESSPGLVEGEGYCWVVEHGAEVPTAVVDRGRPRVSDSTDSGQVTDGFVAPPLDGRADTGSDFSSSPGCCCSRSLKAELGSVVVHFVTSSDFTSGSGRSSTS